MGFIVKLNGYRHENLELLDLVGFASCKSTSSTSSETTRTRTTTLSKLSHRSRFSWVWKMITTCCGPSAVSHCLSLVCFFGGTLLELGHTQYMDIFIGDEIWVFIHKTSIY